MTTLLEHIVAVIKIQIFDFCSNNCMGQIVREYVRNLDLRVQVHPGELWHTSYKSFYKWTKISSLEIIIFELKNDGNKWSRIYFEIDRAPSELLLPSAKTSAQNGQIGLAA